MKYISLPAMPSFDNIKQNKYLFYGIIALIIAIMVGSVYYFKYMRKDGFTTDSNNDLDNVDDQTNDKIAELLVFTVNWCPHCKTAKPEIESLTREYESRKINGYKILVTNIDCTTETPEVLNMLNTYKVEGYPTIKLLKDGQVIEYDAKPTKDTLVQFLNSVL